MVEQKGLFTSHVEMSDPFRWSEEVVTPVERLMKVYIPVVLDDILNNCKTDKQQTNSTTTTLLPDSYTNIHPR